MVCALDGPATGEQFRAILVDISGGGCAIQLPEGAERRLSGTLRMSATLHLPGRRLPETRDVVVRNRAQSEMGTRYGLEWTNQATELPKPTYEPVWDCASCGDTRLLATTHLHCPRCGSAQQPDLRTYFPNWDLIKPSDSHRYSGHSQRCPSCGGMHAHGARHCGGCGTSL
jgi:hypothetical protein